MQANRICLLGFSKSSEELIKSIIKDLPSLTTPITWASAKDKNLTGVIINASFLDTPQIQKYIKLVNKPVVTAYNNDSGQESAEEYASIPSLDLRNTTTKIITEWLGFLINDKNAISANITTNNNKKERFSNNSQRSSNKYSNKRSNSYNALIDHIKAKDSVIIEAKFNDNHTWIQPNKETVFIDYPRETVPGIEKWQWRIENNIEIPDSSRQLKIDLWLFESLWQADIMLDKEILSNTYYQTNRWPQPLGKEGRSQALRLAAFMQNSPVTLELLSQKTGYDKSLIRRFLYAAKVAGQLDEVSIKTSDIQLKTAQPTQEQIEENKQKRGLLSRFRQKLGI